jgi:hypothetical protein
MKGLRPYVIVFLVPFFMAGCGGEKRNGGEHVIRN